MILASDCVASGRIAESLLTSSAPSFESLNRRSRFSFSRRLPWRASGTSPVAMRWATRAATRSRIPCESVRTTGLLFWARERIWIARLTSSLLSVSELKRPCSASLVRSRAYLASMFGAVAVDFSIVCAFTLSLTMMPPTSESDMPRAVSHRQPAAVLILLPLVICLSALSIGFRSEHSPVLAPSS